MTLVSLYYNLEIISIQFNGTMSVIEKCESCPFLTTNICVLTPHTHTYIKRDSHEMKIELPLNLCIEAKEEGKAAYVNSSAMQNRLN